MSEAPSDVSEAPSDLSEAPSDLSAAPSDSRDVLGQGQPSDISAPVEALLLLANEPLSELELAEALSVPTSVVEDCLNELVAFYDETGRGFELRRLGGGWRYYTREEHADLIAHVLLSDTQAKLSSAALETLAVVAYSQPISRARISAVRGVNVDGVVRTLLARGLVTEAGRDADTGAVTFATTGYFLERMGLDSLHDLPPLAPHLPEAEELEAELSQLVALPEPVDGSSTSRPEPVEGSSTGSDQRFPEPVEGLSEHG